MDQTRANRFSFLFQIGGIVLAFVFISLILLVVGADPFTTFKLIWEGATASSSRISNVLVVWVPLVLVTSGLLVTFSAGLWNIGIEGQITLGAILTTGVLRYFMGTSVSPGFAILLSIAAGMLGGAAWAALAGILKTFGGVNEIFGGLGLNFIATALNIGLIFGAWSREGVASMSGTDPFPKEFWLPTFDTVNLSWISLLLSIIGLILIFFLLQGTYFGLKLKAVGKGMRSAFRLGIPTNKYMIASFMVCGLYAGITGALQVVAVYHRLIPSISSGYGYLGLMLAMLINYRAIWIAPIALFFAALNIGGIQLPIVQKLDSSLTGVLQGSLVLFILLMQGFKMRVLGKAEGD
jgi:simple sugar transport system permease protein